MAKMNKVKQELSWHIVEEYLQHIETFIDVFRDEKFTNRFYKLLDYVTEKNSVSEDIEDIYVIVEYKAH